MESKEPPKDGEKEAQVYHHPETGEVISKSLWKKLQKAGPAKKEKKEKPAPKPEGI